MGAAAVLLGGAAVYYWMQRGKWPPVSRKRAMRAADFVEKAAAGDVNAQCSLGVCYKHGLGVQQDLSTAVMWFKRAANAGSPRAKVHLGKCLIKGEGVAADPALGLSLFTEAASMGSADGECRVAQCYETGTGVTTDLDKAAQLYERAAAKGSARAMTRLASFAQRGVGGVLQSDQKAFELCKRAAELGHREAQHDLAVMYDNGTGVRANAAAAKRWYLAAAEQGFAESLRVLGECHEQGGAGFEKDMSKAVEYYAKAANRGLPRAQVRLRLSLCAVR